MKGFIVMDGRARYDLDCASVMEVYEHGISKNKAKKEFYRDYKNQDIDACLVEAEIEQTHDEEVWNLKEVVA